MTDGTSQGLFIVVAIVIFGIFVVMAYILFEDTLSPAMASMFGDTTEKTSKKILESQGIVNTEQFNYTRINGGTEIRITGYKEDTIQKVKIPEQIDGLPVTEIGGTAFYNKGLTSVVLPKTLKRILDGHYSTGGAFSHNSIKNIIIPDNVTYIGHAAFYKNKIANISLGNSVEIIGNDAINENMLTTVKIPDSVKRIEWHTFGGNQIHTVTMGKNVEYINNMAFYRNKLKEFTIPDSVTSMGFMILGMNPLEQVTMPIHLKDTYNPSHIAFAEKSLTSIETVPDFVQYQNVKYIYNE